MACGRLPGMVATSSPLGKTGGRGGIEPAPETEEQYSVLALDYDLSKVAAHSTPTRASMIGATPRETSGVMVTDGAVLFCCINRCAMPFVRRPWIRGGRSSPTGTTRGWIRRSSGSCS